MMGLSKHFEKHAISYSDGFTPYWDPNIFNDPNIKVKILKLHGSLYWLKSASGKIIRVPLKGLEISNVKYFLDECLSEMMIYPALRKEKYSEVYSWLSSKFISELNNSELCIIIGYSFRDKDIRDIVIDSLYKNSKLWLIIINPNASKGTEMFTPEFSDKYTLQVIMADDEENRAIELIRANSNEGKIFISPIKRAIDIQSGAENEQAI